MDTPLDISREFDRMIDAATIVLRDTLGSPNCDSEWAPLIARTALGAAGVLDHLRREHKLEIENASQRQAMGRVHRVIHAQEANGFEWGR